MFNNKKKSNDEYKEISKVDEVDNVSEKERILSENKSALNLISDKKIVVISLIVTNSLSLLVILSLVYAIVFHFPVKQYLWTSDARAVCAAVPLSQPDISAARVIDFAASASVDLHSYDYLNWHRMLGRAMTMYLTPRERVNFESNLSTSGLIKSIEAGGITLTSVTSGRPFIVQEGIRSSDHRYFWKVQVPLTLWYYNMTETKPENRILTMTIVRINPSPINPNGIAIDDLISVQDVAQTNNNQLK